MRTALLVSLAYAGLACAAPDELEDSYKALKDAEGKKDPDRLKESRAGDFEIWRARVIASKQPEDADEVETWKGRVEFAKGVDKYTEYALSVGCTGTDRTRQGGGSGGNATDAESTRANT
jgi:hypothetical protein